MDCKFLVLEFARPLSPLTTSSEYKIVGMSSSEDCELQDLVKQTLEKAGSLSKIRVRILLYENNRKRNFSVYFLSVFSHLLQAELRASIFLALEETGCFQVGGV